MLIHSDDRKLFEEVYKKGMAAAAHLGIEVNVIEPKRRPVAGTSYGVCYIAEKQVSIVLRFKNRTSDGGTWMFDPLDRESVLDTLSHELAHLMAHQRYGNEIRMHGSEFKGCMAEIQEVVKTL